MPEDKRLNEVIRIQKRKNSFVMMDKGFLENCNLSWKAKGILAYLLSKPDNWKVIVGNIINSATDGKTAVYNGLKELSEHGHYVKRPIRNEQGTRIVQWESIVFEVPEDGECLVNTAVSLLPGFQEVENLDIDNQDIENRPLVINDFSNIDFNNIECESAPAQNTYGEFQQVRLTTGQYDALITAYGRDKASDYINRLDRHIASTGKRYKGHYATIQKWIAQDAAKDKPTSQPPKPNRFANFKQRDWDFEQIARMEQQNLLSGKEPTP